jgi:hypothetical protein
VTTNRCADRLLVVMLGCGAATLFAACSSDDSNGTGGVDASGAGAGRDTAPVATGPVTLFDFPVGTQGWFYNDYQGVGTNGAITAPYNLASAKYTTTGPRPTIEWDGTDGYPAGTPGSLKLVVNFTGPDQNVLANVQFKPTVQDWTGKAVTLQIKLDPGFEELYMGGMQLFAQDETWAGAYQWKNWPSDNDWHAYDLDLTMATLKTDDIVQFGVQIISGSTSGSTVDENGNPIFTPRTVTMHVDQIAVQ